MNERSPIDPTLVGLTWARLRREKEHGIKPESPLFRPSKLTRSIVGGMIHHPDRLALSLSIVLAVGVLINLGRQVIEDRTKVQAVISQFNGDNAQPEIIIPPQEGPRLIQPVDPIGQYINNYITNDLGARTIEKFDKLWGATTIELVQIRVIDKEGIWIRDFPDPKFGRRIPTAGPGTGPTWKALYYNPKNLVEGIFQHFIVVKDAKTDEVNIWATRWNSEGGWPTVKQPHFETFRVYDGKWLVEFINEEAASSGKTISGKKLFEQALPPFTFPTENLKGIAL